MFALRTLLVLSAILKLPYYLSLPLLSLYLLYHLPHRQLFLQAVPFPLLVLQSPYHAL